MKSAHAQRNRARWITALFLCGVCLAAPSKPLLAASQKKGQKGPTPLTKEPRVLGTNQPDLAVTVLPLTNKGYIQYQVRNRGLVSTRQPFVVNIYVNNVRKDTITHTILSGKARKKVISKLARLDDCKGGMVRVVVDSQNFVKEYNEANNEHRRLLRPPCPDLAVAREPDGSPKIKVVYASDDLTQMIKERYRLLVTVVNRGHAPMPRSATVYVSSGGPTGKMRRQRHEIAPLAPGEEVSFKTGPWRLTTLFWKARVIVDVSQIINESNENNNQIEWKN